MVFAKALSIKEHQWQIKFGQRSVNKQDEVSMKRSISDQKTNICSVG
jgi:hypothetical protein